MQKQQVENSYVLAPEYRNKFRKATVTSILQDVLRSKLQDVSYHAEGSNLLAKQVSDEIKERLRDLREDTSTNAASNNNNNNNNLDNLTPGLDHRYKLVSQVFILEQRGQGVRIGHRCLWDTDVDNYATASFSNDHIYAIATAYGIYFY